MSSGYIHGPLCHDKETKICFIPLQEPAAFCSVFSFSHSFSRDREEGGWLSFFTANSTAVGDEKSKTNSP